MKFVDEVSLELIAGHGGAGSRHFRREKFVPLGGPDGGNGGRGGSVIFESDPGKHTLLDFHFQSRWKADDGRPGEGSRREGKSAEDLIIRVPVGTEVTDEATGELVADLDIPGAQTVICKGGRGGKGNDFFKSPTNRAPEHAQPGEEGEQKRVLLSLKLVADVGIIGFPNAGKSTFISRVSAARPKIADYPFTTLTPNLGVAKTKSGRNLVLADIPGLIPGAHTGKGLGIKFLKHVERTRVLAHLVSPFEPDGSGGLKPVADSVREINHELREFSQELAQKPQVLVLTKIDALENEERIQELLQELSVFELPIFAISSVTGKGLNEILTQLEQLVI